MGGIQSRRSYWGCGRKYSKIIYNANRWGKKYVLAIVSGCQDEAYMVPSGLAVKGRL